MFTGIVETTAMVEAVERGDGRVTYRIAHPTGDLVVGDSVAIDGVCLTAVRVATDTFDVEVVPETEARTTLGGLTVGSVVNIERPMAASGRFDGHIVQGHVDGVATVRSIVADGDSQRVFFDVPAPLLRYVVEKGSVAVDGVSLTVSAVDDGGFEVALIPHTLEVTALGQREVGDGVNLEIDVLAKYVDRLLEGHR